MFEDAGAPKRRIRGGKSGRYLNATERQFIFWDGEGVRNPAGGKAPQHYALFGCSTGDRIVAPRLSTREMLAFIIRVGKEYPNAWHVAFAFDYDANMILANMRPDQFRTLKRSGFVYVHGYRIEHIPHKWFQVTEYGPDHKNDPSDYTTVRIADLFGFFQCSFLKALHSYIPDDPLMAQLAVVEAGKAGRKSFTYDEIDSITTYWETEIALGQRLAEKLRELLYGVNLKITRWHGPGALANYVYRNQGIADHKTETRKEVYDAARYGYAGGRFELFRVGRHVGPIYGLDINSAYPYGISQLPSLTQGYWRYVSNPSEIVEFGIYHIRLDGSPIGGKRPGPLFHRSEKGSVSFPWRTEGWYWTPEIAGLVKAQPRGFHLLEGWEYVGWEERPFGFVRDMYAERQHAKRQGWGSEKALKLALNSLYGKMAQRTGWERAGGPPTWHQLEWAGWVTANTRAMLYSVMTRMDYSELIAVETDGIYTTADPARLGISDSKELGGWGIDTYDEIMYVQSGMYGKRSGDKWDLKYRGLDAGSITETTLAQHLQAMLPNQLIWPTLNGPTTRFVGYGAALMRAGSGGFKSAHCTWETQTKAIDSGNVGKRVHSRRLCNACAVGATAYEMPHDLIIRSQSMQQQFSARHDIPWLDQDTAEWRNVQELEASLYAV